MTGNTRHARSCPCGRAAFSSSGEIASPWTYFSIRCSSTSASPSIIFSRYSFDLVAHVGRDLDLLVFLAERSSSSSHTSATSSMRSTSAAVLVLARRSAAGWRRGCAPSRLAHHVQAAVEVGADAVHLVDVDDARDAVLVGLPPHRLRLRLDAGDGVEDGDGAVEHAQRALDLDREVDVARRVDDVDAVVAPEAGGGGRRDGDAALLLLHHPVHRGGAFVDLADLVGPPGVVQDALGRRRLARIDVGHDADVARLLQRVLPFHVRPRFLGATCEEAGQPAPPSADAISYQR